MDIRPQVGNGRTNKSTRSRRFSAIVKSSGMSHIFSVEQASKRREKRLKGEYTMNYRHVYMLIIERAMKEAKLRLRPRNQRQKKNFPNQYFEFHHILPKSLFPLWVKRK